MRAITLLILTMAVFAGEACAVAETIVGGAPVTVGTDTIALAIYRMDGGSGQTLVSSGIPLPLGRLLAADIGKVRLVVGGIEVPIYIEALKGKHRDGSLRSVLVQFSQAVSTGTPVSAILEFGKEGARNATKIAVNWDMAPAVVLPTSPAYLLSTGIIPPTVAADAMPRGAPFDQYGTVYEQYSAFYASSSDNYYDRAFNNYVYWARTGNPIYWERATRLVRVYAAPAAIYQPHVFQPDGLFVNYLLTGDERSRQYLIDWTAIRIVWWTPSRNYDFGFTVGDGGYREGRQQQRILLSVLYCGILEDASNNWQAIADEVVTAWIETQEPKFAFPVDGLTGVAGAWHYPLGTFGNGQSNFMEGLRSTAMISYYELSDLSAARRTAIEASIKAQVDFLWNTQWNPTYKSFAYWSNANAWAGNEGRAITADLWQNQRELNNLMVLGFGFTYHTTGNTVYRSRATEILSVAFVPPDTWSPWWPGLGGKIFNENYYSSWRAFHYLTIPPLR